MNKIIIIGNLTRDPEMKSTATGKSVCTFTVAVNRAGRESGEEADFFRVSAWGKLGENCGRFLAKGRKAAVIGDLSVRIYDGRDGQKKHSLEITASEVEFLSGRKEQEEKPAESRDFEDVSTDDIPF